MNELVQHARGAAIPCRHVPIAEARAMGQAVLDTPSRTVGTLQKVAQIKFGALVGENKAK